MPEPSSPVVRARSAPAPLTGTLVALALCGVVPLLLAGFGAPSGAPEAVLVLTVVVVVSGARFAWVVASRIRRLHELVVWLFVYLFLGVAPIVQLKSRMPGTTPGIDDAFATQASVIVLIGSIAIMIGSRLARRTRNARPVRASAVHAGRVYALAIVALALAALYVSQVGLGSLFAARADLGAAREETIGGPLGSIIVAGAKMGLLVAFVAFVQLWRQRRASGATPPWFMTAIVFVALVVCVNPISSARYVFGTVALAVLGSLGVYATVRRFRFVAVAALAGMVVAFPLLDTFRRTLDADVQLESPAEALVSGDFDAFAQLMNTCEFVVERGITYGTQMLGVVFSWVPRDAWPSKPLDTGTLLAQFKEYNFQNLSAPLWAELFINFGWLGLVIGMAAFGFLIRRLDTRSEVALRLYGTPGIVGAIVPFYLLIVLRGSLLQATTNLIVIVAFSWFVMRRSRTEELSTASQPASSRAASR